MKLNHCGIFYIILHYSYQIAKTPYNTKMRYLYYNVLALCHFALVKAKFHCFTVYFKSFLTKSSFKKSNETLIARNDSRRVGECVWNGNGS